MQSSLDPEWRINPLTLDGHGCWNFDACLFFKVRFIFWWQVTPQTFFRGMESTKAWSCIGSLGESCDIWQVRWVVPEGRGIPPDTSPSSCLPSLLSWETEIGACGSTDPSEAPLSNADSCIGYRSHQGEDATELWRQLGWWKWQAWGMLTVMGNRHLGAGMLAAFTKHI